MKINRIFENTRFSQWDQFGIIETGSQAFVLLAANLMISRRLYREAALEFPMRLSVWVTRVGESSVDIHQSLEVWVDRVKVGLHCYHAVLVVL